MRTNCNWYEPFPEAFYRQLENELDYMQKICAEIPTKSMVYVGNAEIPQCDTTAFPIHNLPRPPNLQSLKRTGHYDNSSHSNESFAG